MAAPQAIEQTGAGAALDRAALMSRGRPLVIRGLVRDWPLVRLAGTSDTAFAERLAALDSGQPVDTLLMPPEAEGLVGYNAALDGFNYEHYRIPLTLGLQRLASYSRVDRPPGLAIQSAPIATCAPGFLEHHALPLLEGQVQPRLWIGNRVTTPTHFDSQHNIACVVCGRRRFTLFPPEQLPNLYIGPLDFAPTSAMIGMARPDRPDDPRFPRLKQALAAAQVAELGPGDAIYMPPLWWHHVESLERLNALVNYWWLSVDEQGYTTGHALSALFHGILAYRGLPPAERAGWKRLLEHYAFGDGDPLEHIPQERRGVSGTRTPQVLERLRELAKRHL
ncbi:cupin-like domain-containing protein [Frateuria sp. GZRR33]|uniref:cupin-like domain-containing protein n=1 Tax=Frateuria sp. GZRR33 TaxID=3351535 RepID=UPI003EDB79EF